MNLLVEARAAGLVVKIDGDRLVITGPRRAEVTVQKLLQHKAEVMAALAAPVRTTPQQQPPGPKEDKPRSRPQCPTQAKPAPAAKDTLCWPVQPTALHHRILGRRLRWVDASGRYRVEVFPDNRGHVFMVQHVRNDWKVIEHHRTLKAAQASCLKHLKQTEKEAATEAAKAS